MCGIFFTNSTDSLETEKYQMFQTLKHRGPDVSVFRRERNNTRNNVYGFHRLAIIDPVNSIVQPFFYKHIVMLCNGEIYNWKQLYKRYVMTFQPVETLPTDCGIIPLLYEYFQGDFVEVVKELEGEFAIVLYDTLQNKVFATRDFMGVRPLYYTTHESNIWLASELKALPSQYPVRHIEPRKTYCFDLSEYTIYTEEYWDFPDYSEIQPLSSLDTNDILTQIYNRLKYSVAQRLQSDQPIGCLLSGGIDSSLIVALAASMHPNIQCFTIGVPGSPDVKAAQRVAEFLKVPLTVVDFSIEEGIASIVPVIYHLETYDITTIRASIPQYLLAKWIRTHTNIRVLLSGEGSDELFSGYIYSKLAPTSKELFKDGIRLLDELYYYDCLRTDRTLSAWGLEVRVPFLHPYLVDFVLGLDPELRMCSSEPLHGIERKLEKGLLRSMIYKYGLLPEDICFRPKEAFSDAVSAQGQISWYRSIQKWIEPFEFELSKPAVKNPPLSQESKFYRHIFQVLFPKQEHILPAFWMPRWTQQTDPSATVLACHHSNG
jgi:asparagine synthase (glutamine-hydrolysing)